ncbi:MAG: hypothetical protein L6437_09785 [Kiritimatiellae bacterium]|nr:hypothetical protein [Verrucomicrobiota bacterium]MCG2660522.1 hypothetical protein [Kiritimatiellia bacterium]
MQSRNQAVRRRPGWGATPEFIISFWVEPPAEETTLRRYREIAECGFNVVPINHDKKRNLKALDLCRAAGLKGWVGDLRSFIQPDVPVFAETLNQLIADFSRHPALAGYYVRDEPHASLFPVLGALNRYLLDHDPRRLPYINLFPNHAGSALLGTKTYEEHIAEFIRIVRPALVCWDHYPLLKTGEDGCYFDNLEIVRRQCLKADIPFMQIILCTPVGDHRNPDETDLWWQIYTTLCYGARGISYFTYWTPPQWTDGIIAADGARTPHYEMVKRLNARVQALAPTLIRLRSCGIYHTDPVPSGARPLEGQSPVKRIIGGQMAVGWLKDHHQLDYLFIVNRSFRETISADVEIRKGLKAVEEISQDHGCPVSAEYRRGMLTCVLKAGEGKLFRLRS